MQEIKIIKKPITRIGLKKIAEVTKNFFHKDLASGRWFELSLAEQLGNIGSEVSRARNSQNINNERFERSVTRALELFYLTLSDRRWVGRLKEIGRVREVFCDAIFGGKEYKSNLLDLEKYFNYFALAVRQKTVFQRN